MMSARIIVIISLLVGVTSYAHADALISSAIAVSESASLPGSEHDTAGDERHSNASGEMESPLHCGGAIVMSDVAAVDHPKEASSPTRDLTNASRFGTAPSPRHPPPRV